MEESPQQTVQPTDEKKEGLPAGNNNRFFFNLYIFYNYYG